jgi:hypothetical protein
VVEEFRKEIGPMIGKILKESFIIDSVWGIIGNRIKQGL